MPTPLTMASSFPVAPVTAMAAENVRSVMSVATPCLVGLAHAAWWREAWEPNGRKERVEERCTDAG